mmetsp:Transcript_61907/g.142596  ORF Transcript_61907/g.142596 Transcript_61907/m.142596 type:complete len:230 (-) Transcript_61907:341-1030(-)
MRRMKPSASSTRRSPKTVKCSTEPWDDSNSKSNSKQPLGAVAKLAARRLACRTTMAEIACASSKYSEVPTTSRAVSRIQGRKSGPCADHTAIPQRTAYSSTTRLCFSREAARAHLASRSRVIVLPTKATPTMPSSRPTRAVALSARSSLSPDAVSSGNSNSTVPPAPDMSPVNSVLTASRASSAVNSSTKCSPIAESAATPVNSSVRRFHSVMVRFPSTPSIGTLPNSI